MSLSALLHQTRAQTVEQYRDVDHTLTNSADLVIEDQIKRMNDIQIYTLPVSYFKKDAYKNCRQIVCERLQEIQLTRDYQHATPFLSVGMLQQLTGKKLQNAAKKIPLKALCFLKDSQVRSLKFSSLPPKQLKEIFHENDNFKRYRLLSQKQILDVVSKMDKETLSLVPEQYLREIPISKLSKNRIESLFPFNVRENKAKRAFTCLPMREINQCFHKLDDYFITWLCPEQLRFLDTSKLSKRQIEALIPSQNLKPGWDKKVLVKKEETYHLFTKKGRNGTHYTTQMDDGEYNRQMNHVKISNLRKLKSLGKTQLDVIKDKLSPENQKLIDLK